MEQFDMPEFDLAFDLMNEDPVNLMPLIIGFTDDELVGELTSYEQDETEYQPQHRTLQPVTTNAPTFPEVVQSTTKRRFANCTEDELLCLEDERHEQKTKDNTAWALRLFREWRQGNSKPSDFEHLPTGELAADLRKFYAEVRKANGGRYSKSSLLNIRAALQRHLSSPPTNRSINIITNEEFNAANNVFDGSLKKIKKTGMDKSVSHPEISEEDMDRLFTSDVLSTDNPVSLQRLVFFNLQYYFCRRGREGLRQLQKSSFEVRTDASGREYLAPTSNEHEKNHPGTMSGDTYKQVNKKVYATGDKQCPVQAYKLYISTLHPLCPWLYQQPKKDVSPSSKIWYNNVPLGHNTIGSLMKDISKAAGLSLIYTNHCIRATAITVLNNAGTSDRIICSLSGHRNVNSLRSYCRDASDRQKQDMSEALSVSRRRVTSSTVPISAPAPLVSQPMSIPAPAPVTAPAFISQPQNPTRNQPQASCQPPMTGHIVRRNTSSSSTTTSSLTSILNNIGNPPQPRDHPAIFTNCNFDGATLNFHFGS